MRSEPRKKRGKKERKIICVATVARVVARRLMSYGSGGCRARRSGQEHPPGLVPAASGAPLGAGPSPAVKHEPGLKGLRLGYRCVMVTKALFWLKWKMFLSFHNIYLQMYGPPADQDR